MLNEVEKAQPPVTLDQLKILTLNANAEPLGWVKYEEYAYYASSNKILWTLGQYEITLRGGINARTGLQSKMVIDSIIALDNKTSPYSYRKHAPALTNSALFERDKNLCAYCGSQFKRQELTREHIMPKSKGGKNTWENVVAACKPCNGLKDNRTPEQAGMELLFLPYCPNFHEDLILKNKSILADQMEFLLRGVHKNSRLHLNA